MSSLETGRDQSNIKNHDIKGYSEQRPSTVSEWVRYWYDTIGVNVIPANSRIKKPLVEWKPYQTIPIPKEQIDAWLGAGTFNSGLALIAGKIWRGKHEGQYLVFIDMDSSTAIDAFCGSTKLSRLAEKTIVEQHLDNPKKAHTYFITPSSIPAKGSNKLGLEVKSEGKHGLAYCTPSIHKKGHPYQIIGTLTPLAITEDGTKDLEQRLKRIFEKYGMKYERRLTSNSSAIEEPEYTNKLSDYRIRKIVKLLVPRYKEGIRNNIVLHLSGLLRKEGVPRADAEKIVQQICSKSGLTDNMDKTLDTIRRTYEKNINEISGFTGLKEVLG